jgi:hypothetical protein
MNPLSWHKWLKRPSLCSSRSDRPGRPAKGRRFRPPTLERLEDRLTPASTLTVAGGSAVFAAETGVTHDLTVSVSGGTYTFNDALDTVSLNGGTAAHTVTTTGITAGGTITLNMGDLNDTVNIRSINNATTVKSIAGGAATDTLTYGSGYSKAVSVTLASSNATGFSSWAATGITNGFAGIDVLKGTGSSTLSGEKLPVPGRRRRRSRATAPTLTTFPTA